MEIRSMATEAQLEGLCMTPVENTRYASFRFFHGRKNIILHIDLGSFYLDYWIVNEKKRYLFAKKDGEVEDRSLGPQTRVVAFNHTYVWKGGMIPCCGIGGAHSNLPLSSDMLHKSMTGLCGDYNSTDFALGITTYITSFLETARSDDMRDFVVFCLGSPEPILFGQSNVDEVHIWGNVSRYLVYWFERTQGVLDLSTVSVEKIKSRVAYILKTVGVLKRPTCQTTRAFLTKFEKLASKEGSSLHNYFEKMEKEEGPDVSFYREVVEIIFLDWQLQNQTENHQPQSRRKIVDKQPGSSRQARFGKNRSEGSTSKRNREEDEQKYRKWDSTKETGKSEQVYKSKGDGSGDRIEDMARSKRKIEDDRWDEQREQKYRKWDLTSERESKSYKRKEERDSKPMRPEGGDPEYKFNESRNEDRRDHVDRDGYGQSKRERGDDEERRGRKSERDGDEETHKRYREHQRGGRGRVKEEERVIEKDERERDSRRDEEPLKRDCEHQRGGREREKGEERFSARDEREGKYKRDEESPVRDREHQRSGRGREKEEERVRVRDEREGENKRDEEVYRRDRELQRRGREKEEEHVGAKDERDGYYASKRARDYDDDDDRDDDRRLRRR